MESFVTVIGAGLAGSECAWQLAERGIKVRLYEMKPHKKTPAHVSNDFAELVCSNSFRSDELSNAVGLLKEELRRMGSLIMKCADANRVPAGGALAVDREGYARMVTEHIRNHPNIEVIEEEVTEIPEGEVVIASGPLTSDALADKIAQLCPDSDLHFYDAAAPIVMADSIDMSSAFYASRYDKGTADYINCPMDKEEYLAFWQELCSAEQAHVHGFDAARRFCLEQTSIPTSANSPVASVLWRRVAAAVVTAKLLPQQRFPFAVWAKSSSSCALLPKQAASARKHLCSQSVTLLCARQERSSLAIFLQQRAMRLSTI